MAKSNPADPPLILRAALRAYPPADRDGYGDELLEAAVELSSFESSRRREALGLVRGGLEARAARTRLGLAAVDFPAALRLLTFPITAAAVMVWGVAAGVRVAGGAHAPGLHGPSVGSVLLLALLSALVAGVGRRQRGIATVAASGLLLQVFCSALWSATRGGFITAAPALHLHLGAWWFGPNLIWSLIPLLILLPPACWVMEPAAPRVEGLRRPWREQAIVRAAGLLVPVTALTALVMVAPRFLVDDVSETTELPGILFLILIVSALWIATSVRPHRDAASTAAALAGLALAPSVAYGAARFVVTPFRGLVADRDLLVAIAAAAAVLLVVLAAAFFVVVIAHVGLRTIDRLGGSPLTVGHAVSISADDPAHAR